MAPGRPLKTYSRGNNSSVSCVDAFNILFAKNLTARKLNGKVDKAKSKIKIKELPKKIKTVLSYESSLHLHTDDTFDNLLKGPQYHVVKAKELSVKISASNVSNSVIRNFSISTFSPMLNKLRSHSSRAQIRDVTNSISWFKQRTESGERITNELEIDNAEKSKSKQEKIDKNKSKSIKKQNSLRESPIMLRSRTKLPDIMVTGASNTDQKSIEKKNNAKDSKTNKNETASMLADLNLTFDPIFTNSVRERIFLHSSTPLVSNHVKRLMKQPLSPIKNVDDEVKSCIVESLEEIKNWDTSFPKIDPKAVQDDSLKDTDDFEGFTFEEKRGKSTFELKKDNFVTVRGRPIKRFTLNESENNGKSKSTKKVSNFQTKSFYLEDFEQFHKSLNQTLTRKLTSFSLKDFETFHAQCKGLVSFKNDHFLDLSSNSTSFVTYRKARMSVSKKYLALNKKFGLKELVVVLDKVLVNDSSAKLRKRGKSMTNQSLLKSIIKRQPVVKLTKLSVGRLDKFKAKNRLTRTSYVPCRKFSSNFVPSYRRSRANYESNSDTSLDDLEIKDLFVNVIRMPMDHSEGSSILEESVEEVTYDVSSGKGKSKTAISVISTNIKEISFSKNENSRVLGISNGHSYTRSKNFFEISQNDSHTDDELHVLSSTDEEHSYCKPHNREKERQSSSRGKKSLISVKNKSPKNILDDLDVSSIKNVVKTLDSHAKTDKSGVVEYVLSPALKDSREHRLTSRISIIMQTELRRSASDTNLQRTSDVLKNDVQLGYSRVLRSNSSSPKCDFFKSSPKQKTEVTSLPEISRMRELVVNLSLKKFEDSPETMRSIVECRRVTRSSGSVSRKSGDNKKENTSTGDSKTNRGRSLLKSDKNKERVFKCTPFTNKSLCCVPDSSNSCKSSCFDSSTSLDVIESSINSPQDCFRVPLGFSKWKQKVLNLKAGKSWRRSLLVHRREGIIDLTEDLSSKNGNLCLNSTREHFMIPQNVSVKRQSIRIVPACEQRISKRKTALQNYAQTNLSTVLDETVTEIIGVSPTKRKSSIDRPLPIVTAKEIVLKRCGQSEPLPFEKCYPGILLKDCKKIGEGVYGEVFLYKNPSNETTVMKVIPIEGDKIINGERQKKFDEILSEIVIALELSKLRKNSKNQTSAFSEVQRICCVKGKYPKKLLDLWHDFDNLKVSENDPPEVFDKEQLYIVLDLANGGRDLEAFVFNNASQAVAMFKQVACALAVAEQQLNFEHRDLHWGNVLLTSVDKNKKVVCKHKGQQIVSHTRGVEVTIIDFTLSRIEHEGVVIFNDLGLDPDLFGAQGDYQFEIYRLMKTKNENDWQKFEPYTNILWLHYIINKSITALRYKNIKTKIHRDSIQIFKKMERSVLDFKSASDFVSCHY